MTRQRSLVLKFQPIEVNRNLFVPMKLFSVYPSENWQALGMRETDAEALRILVDELRRNVRAGDFTKSEIQKEVWANRQLLPEDGFHRLSIHTLSWEYFHSRGDQDAAAARLRDGQVVESAVRLVEEWSQAPGRFVEAEFPPDLPDEERRRRYNLWRQRAVGSLAWCMVSHQRRESGWKELLASVESFIDVCLGSAGFGCTGTRARFHFIRAQIHESNNETPEAVSDYDRSLHYCIKRANERLGSGQSDGQQEIERAFAIYSLGKLKLRLGQIDFEMGQLASAKGHAREAGLLLRVSRDPFLPEMANLLSYCIERQESTFYARGGDVVARMESVREGLQEHRPFFLKASIEQLITRVYLTGAQPGGSAGRAANSHRGAHGTEESLFPGAAAWTARPATPRVAGKRPDPAQARRHGEGARGGGRCAQDRRYRERQGGGFVCRRQDLGGPGDSSSRLRKGPGRTEVFRRSTGQFQAGASHESPEREFSARV